MKGFLLTVLELAVLVAIILFVVAEPAMLDHAVGTPDADERFLMAAWEGDAELVEEALADGASVHARSDNGSTAMLHAAWGGHAALVERLIALGTDVNAGNNNGVTPLMSAASSDHDEVVRILLAHGADPRIRTHVAPIDTFDVAATRSAKRTQVLLRQWEPPSHPRIFSRPADTWTPEPVDARR
jgi:ankyrin repeat protein